MRKKLLFGTIALFALAAALGERYFNRATGQNIPLPKAPQPEKKDLFDLLKKDLEAKKDTPTFPALPSVKKDDLEAKKDAPTFPGLPSVKKDEPTAPPTIIPPSIPSVSVPKAGEKGVGASTPASQSSIHMNDSSAPKPQANQVPSFPPVKDTTAPLPKSTNEAPPSFDPMSKEPAKFDSAKPQAPFPEDPPPANTKSGTAPQPVVLPKNSPWSLNVVMVDGQTIVTAVVNKKHEFKILCQTLDLQTGKGVLKALGKVQISGDALNGTCEHLSISLMEDRLVLQGPSLVSIDRSAANVSDATPASFELKGDRIDLRISELQSAGLTIPNRSVDARPAARGDAPGRVVAASMKLDGTQWTPYGQLRAAKTGGNMWSLESSDGAVIAYLLAREGGSLERYVGQSISVYGTREREHGGQPVLRVTHIALP